MALIYCRECGQQISEHANSCPKCGAPNQTQNTKGSNKGVLIAILLIAVLGTVGYLYLTSEAVPAPTLEQRQERIDAADRLLSRNCDVLGNMATEYIKDGVAKSILGAIANNKCDCVKQKLVEKLADKYTLPQIQAFEKMPLHEVQEIKSLIEENNEELKACFPFANKAKEAL